MKSLIYLILILFCVQLNVFSQKKHDRQIVVGTEIGFTGSLGVANINCKNINSDENIKAIPLNFANQYGGRLAITRIAKKPFSSMISFYGEYIFNNYKKSFDIDLNSIYAKTYVKNLKFNTLEYIAALRYIYFFGNYYQNPIYFDFGFSISNLKKISEKNSIESSLFNSHNADYKLIDNFNSNLKAIVFGTGFYGKMFNLGINLHYQLDDLLQPNKYLISDGVYDNPVFNSEYNSQYSNFSATNLFSMQIKLEFNMALFSFRRCSNGSKSFLFFHFPVDVRYYWK